MSSFPRILVKSSSLLPSYIKVKYAVHAKQLSPEKLERRILASNSLRKGRKFASIIL